MKIGYAPPYSRIHDWWLPGELFGAQILQPPLVLGSVLGNTFFVGRIHGVSRPGVGLIFVHSSYIISQHAIFHIDTWDININFRTYIIFNNSIQRQTFLTSASRVCYTPSLLLSSIRRKQYHAHISNDHACFIVWWSQNYLTYKYWHHVGVAVCH